MKARLITNVSYITVYETEDTRGVRTNASALLIESPMDRDMGFGSGRAWKLRAFGPDPAWPVFDYPLGESEDEALGYAQQDHQGNAILLRDDGEGVPINSGVVLRWESGPILNLSVADYERPFQVDDFEGTHEDGFFDRLWPALEDRTREFWTMPNMPLLAHMPPAQVETFQREKRIAMGRV